MIKKRRGNCSFMFVKNTYGALTVHYVKHLGLRRSQTTFRAIIEACRIDELKASSLKTKTPLFSYPPRRFHHPHPLVSDTYSHTVCENSTYYIGFRVRFIQRRTRQTE